MDDNYIESAIWSQKDMKSLSESEMLSSGIPKLIWLYKSRFVVGRIAELNAILASDHTEEQETDCLRELTRLNKLKVTIANQLKRLII